MEGWRGSKLSKSSTMEERESAKSYPPIGEEGPLNRWPENLAVGHRFAQGRFYRPKGRYYRPTQISPPTALCENLQGRYFRKKTR